MVLLAIAIGAGDSRLEAGLFGQGAKLLDDPYKVYLLCFRICDLDQSIHDLSSLLPGDGTIN
jgi:hypothetical protein